MNRQISDMTLKLDELREIFNIGVGGAATALNKIIKEPIMMTVPEIELLRADRLVERVGPPDRIVVTVYIKVATNFPCGILLVFDEESARALVELTSSGACSCIDDEHAVSALKEVVNIMCSYFLNNLSKFLKKTLLPGVPAFAVDMLGAVLDSAVCDNAGTSLDVLMVQAQLFGRSGVFNVDFLLIPETSSLGELLETD